MRYSFAYFIALLLVIGIIDWLQKHVFKELKWARKLTHTTTGLIVCTFPLVLDKIQIVILSILFVLMMGVSKLKNILSLHTVSRKTWGELIFPLSIGVAALVSLPHHPKAYFVGILCLSIADTLASVVGKLMPLKMIKIGKHSKSVGGFLACVLAVFSILLIFYPLHGNSFFYLLGFTLIISLTELISVYGLDNLSVPLTASFLCVVGETQLMI